MNRLTLNGFAKAAIVRAIRTMAQTAIAMIGTSSIIAEVGGALSG